MIENLAVGKSAAFFTIRAKLTHAVVDELFKQLRSKHGTKRKNVFSHIRERHGDTRWSAICFKYKAPPVFLDSASELREELLGYLLLVEYQKHAALFSSRLSLPSSFKTQHLAPVATSRVEGAIAHGNAVFQKIRMRNMSVSPHVMRNKTLEAPNLANVVGPAGIRRYAPQTYAVTHEGTYSTATPSTGRIGVRSGKVKHEDLIEFAVTTIDALRQDPVDVSPFIKTFARPISLTEALKLSQPSAIAVDTARLAASVIGDEATHRLVRTTEETSELSIDEIHELFRDLETALEIKGKGKMRSASLPKEGAECAKISLNKSRIALRSLTLGASASVKVESRSVALGNDPDQRALHSFIDEENSFIVLFDDICLSYIGGQVFQDEAMLDGGKGVLPYLHPEGSLQTVVSEKGDFVANQVKFDDTSTFGAIVDHIAAEDDTLVCDDLGDEWADFIGFRENAGFVQVSFYHAKHGPLELSAGSFHIAVSQAIKNLGNMMLPPERMEAKIQGWSTTYNAPNQPTKIEKIIRSNTGDLSASFARGRTAPDVRRRAIIVTSSLSKKEVEAAFTDIQNGQRPSHSFVQLYWLLQSFFSACTEVGATGSIVCQP